MKKITALFMGTLIIGAVFQNHIKIAAAEPENQPTVAEQLEWKGFMGEHELMGINRGNITKLDITHREHEGKATLKTQRFLNISMRDKADKTKTIVAIWEDKASAEDLITFEFNENMQKITVMLVPDQAWMSERRKINIFHSQLALDFPVKFRIKGPKKMIDKWFRSGAGAFQLEWKVPEHFFPESFHSPPRPDKLFPRKERTPSTPSTRS